MGLPRCVNTVLTQLKREGIISEDIMSKIEQRYKIIDEESEEVLKLVNSTGIQAKIVSYFLGRGFFEEELTQIGKVVNEYNVNKRTLKQYILHFTNEGVPSRDVAGLIEVREMLRRKGVLYTATPQTLAYDLTVGMYKHFRGEKGGVEDLRQYAEFILANADLIRAALPYTPSNVDMRKIECLYVLPIYELSGRDPEKTRENLEWIIETYQRTS